MSHESARAASGRLAYLDSLRGIAAMVVVLHHCLVTAPVLWSLYDNGPHRFTGFPWLITFTPLHLLWDGPEAVCVFFVLSGIALTMMLSDKGLAYRAYCARRVTRLYIPYAAAVAVAMAFVAFSNGSDTHGYSKWVGLFWTEPPTIKAVIDHVFMLGLAQYNSFDPVVWSLVHEMRMSLIFPVFLLTYRRVGWMKSLIAAFVISLAAKAASTVIPDTSITGSLVATTQYTFLFVAGIALASDLQEFRAWLANRPKHAPAVIMLIGLGLLNIKWQFPSAADSSMFRVVCWLGVHCGSVCLLASTLTWERAQLFLGHRMLHWLGRISYSLYLIHVVVLFCVIRFLPWHFPAPALLAIVPALSLLIGAGMFALIERPAIGLSRSWGRKLGDSTLARKENQTNEPGTGRSGNSAGSDQKIEGAAVEAFPAARSSSP
jgi:peptidoglycan/LPS O-acetylase OafA/YrhL